MQKADVDKENLSNLVLADGKKRKILRNTEMET